jgi:selenocysteine lyase/cysteine desulfurase
MASVVPLDASLDHSPDQAPVGCQRALFSPELTQEGQAYLNSAYMGPLPLAAQQAGLRALAQRAVPTDIHPADFFTHADRVRAQCAALVHAQAAQVCLIPTVSYGMAMVAKHLQTQGAVRPGAQVVVLGEQFPSGVYPWRNWRSLGVDVCAVPAPDAPWSALRSGQPSRAQRWNDAIEQAIGPQTALVCMEQAHWTDGTLFDLARIGQRCREVGAVFVVDATQTAGAMPLDFAAIGADALIVHAYKSMLCNYGLGFAALGPRFLEASPLEESWLMRHGSEDFAGLVNYQDAYAADMRRFDTPLRASPVLIHMLDACTQLLLQWRPERIRRYLLGIERDFVQTVCSHGFDVADEADRAANIFAVKLPAHLQAQAAQRALAQRKIWVSVRAQAVRISPHVYNSEADLALLADALRSL